MTLAQFKYKYNGKYGVNFTDNPDYAGQCVQLVELKWLEDNKIPRNKIPLYPDAAAYWEKGVKFCSKIDPKRDKHGNPTVFPKRGDVVVFDRHQPGSQGHGHIDICLTRKNKHGFKALDSNWHPLKVTVERHDYSHVLGYLRNKK